MWKFLLSLLAGAGAATVLAGPQPCQPDAEQALRAINALRAEPRACGAQAMPAAAALRWSGPLADSSRRFAQELARRGLLTHEGEQLHGMRERMQASGYAMRLAGENLAAGAETLNEVLQQWLSSPGHCENLMLAEFRDVGLACAIGAAPEDRYGRYWVMQLGRPAVER
ncbi:CAP domain-containing protein [Roseateles violae]|uniref:CAP domain-containing protein n=1 Tax=Roseateles violae TaxID=3058042 RepID=A0ABT8DLS7_9BURK|nr:CAP domain-containing protein [Pelomonas sp. PFR6]MDN3918858.1 CAP domain-containing protein [Pelomonas sp. PFR6]